MYFSALVDMVLPEEPEPEATFIPEDEYIAEEPNVRFGTQQQDIHVQVNLSEVKVIENHRIGVNWNCSQEEEEIQSEIPEPCSETSQGQQEQRTETSQSPKVRINRQHLTTL